MTDTCDEIRERITKMKSVWDQLEQISSEAWGNKIYFLSHHLSGLKEHYDKELLCLREDLCKARGE